MMRPAWCNNSPARLWFICLAQWPMNQRSGCGNTRQACMGGTARAWPVTTTAATAATAAAGAANGDDAGRSRWPSAHPACARASPGCVSKVPSPCDCRVAASGESTNRRAWNALLEKCRTAGPHKKWAAGKAWGHRKTQFARQCIQVLFANARSGDAALTTMTAAIQLPSVLARCNGAPWMQAKETSEQRGYQ